MWSAMDTTGIEDMTGIEGTTGTGIMTAIEDTTGMKDTTGAAGMKTGIRPDGLEAPAAAPL
jgi:hypothetical protein